MVSSLKYDSNTNKFRTLTGIDTDINEEPFQLSNKKEDQEEEQGRNHLGREGFQGSYSSPSSDEIGYTFEIEKTEGQNQNLSDAESLDSYALLEQKIKETSTEVKEKRKFDRTNLPNPPLHKDKTKSSLMLSLWIVMYPRSDN